MSKINGQTIRKFKLRRTYSIKEISLILGVHPHTVRLWQKSGLKPISANDIPRLFFGKDVRDFLIKWRSRNKTKLLPNEFYCFRCRAAAKSIPDKLYIEHTEKRIGHTEKEAIVHGVCDVCGATCRRQSTHKKAKESFGEGTVFRQGVDRLE